MKSKSHMKSLVVGVILGATLAFTIAATTAAPVSWEYSVVTERYPVDPGHPHYKELRARDLNRYSKDGWEILSSNTIYYTDFNNGKHEEVRGREVLLRRIKQ